MDDPKERSLVFLEMSAEALRVRRARYDACVIPNDISLSSTDHLLHVLRNPYGWSENTVRSARVAAAELVESVVSLLPAGRGNTQEDVVSSLRRTQEERNMLRFRVETLEHELRVVTARFCQVDAELARLRAENTSDLSQFSGDLPDFYG